MSTLERRIEGTKAALLEIDRPDLADRVQSADRSRARSLAKGHPDVERVIWWSQPPTVEERLIMRKAALLVAGPGMLTPCSSCWVATGGTVINTGCPQFLAKQVLAGITCSRWSS